MTAKFWLSLLFVVTGLCAVVLWKNAADELPFAIQGMSLNDCTFACNSGTVAGFWSLVVFATFLTLGAACFAVLAHFSGASKVEECSSC